ncbi:tail fiber assembly protein [Cronobacter turicensis]|nr:tail fiber assembly protein [Cronobacter turicensis]ELY4852447.1 tail fiber assembly protein [Cronobacter turicensis]
MGLMLFTVALGIDYRASGALSNDAPIRDDLYHSLIEGLADGRIMTSDETGQSKWINPMIDLREQAEARRQMLLLQVHSVTVDWRVELMVGTIVDSDRTCLLK